MKSLHVMSCALLAASIVPVPALAERSVRIQVEDSDLSSPASSANLYTRIGKTAVLLCRDSISPWDARRNASMKRCASAAIDHAVRQANSPVLTALHRSKTQHGEFAALKD